MNATNIFKKHIINGIQKIKKIVGGDIDIHKAIKNLPKPKKRCTLPGHSYIGPYLD